VGRRLTRDETLACPRCYESGAGVAELVQTRPARTVASAPYLRVRRFRCGACGFQCLSVERVTFLGLRRAAGVTPAALRALQEQQAGGGEDYQGDSPAENQAENETD
jgi:hypothetical protein